MNSSYELSFGSYDNSIQHNSTRKGGINISNELDDMCERLRVSALTNAAEISPLVNEITIGPNSPVKKYDYKDTTPVIKEEIPPINLLEDTLREDLRYTLLLKKCEKQIQESSYELFNDILGNMLTKHAETIKQFWETQEQTCQRRNLQFKERKVKMLKCLKDSDNMSLLAQARNDEQHYQIITNNTIENMNKILEQNRFAAISESYAKIYKYYDEICNLIKTEPLAKTVCDKYVVGINVVVENMNAIMDCCSTGSVLDKDVKQAMLLALNIENIRIKINNDLETVKKEEIINKQKQEEMQKKQELLEREQKAQALKLAAEAAAVEKQKIKEAKKTKPMFYSSKNYNYYEELQNYLDQYEAQYQDLLQNVNLKKFRFDCQKAVNTPVNAISSVSALHMRDKYEKLSKLLKGEQVQVLDVYVTATQHPQGLAYCTALLAKKIVRQGDLLVSSNTEAAYPLAAVAVALWAQFPHFGKLVEAYFHRLCPYLVPMFLPQKQGQSDKEFYLSRGYTYNDDGVVEKQDKFLKRMSGIFRLRCAIWTAKMPRFLNAPHPHGLQNAWQWLASFVNLKAEPDISATLLHDFYIMCGSTCHKYYGIQFKKILFLTSSQYLKVLESIDEGGPKTRLEVYLQTVLRSNDIPQPPTPAQPITW